MEKKKFEPPNDKAGMTFLSKKAGSFSGVPQRTVQNWTENLLIESKTSGTGDRRRYTTLNCIEIGIISALAQHRVSFDVITDVMTALRRGRPLTLEQALADNRAFLIIRYYRTWKPGISCVTDKRFGPRSGIKGETRDFNQFWLDTTIPQDNNHQKTFILDLSYIAKLVLSKIQNE
jgi:DNA-binding transcriptional MerR regulator